MSTELTVGTGSIFENKILNKNETGIIQGIAFKNNLLRNVSASYSHTLNMRPSLSTSIAIITT